LPRRELDETVCDQARLARDARFDGRLSLARDGVMRYCTTSTPVGRLLITGDKNGLRGISFLSGLHPAAVLESWEPAEEPFREAVAQLAAYFAGRLRRFDLALAPEGTPFQRDVWSALTEIPYGETVSYSELARRIGRPAATRAVGAANGKNPLPIVIPCHRVIGANGSLTGFGGGISIKRRLLDLESGLPGLLTEN
jgi:methylated-DNA-[protein]-cysteine S-methyltransferase